MAIAKRHRIADCEMEDEETEEGKRKGRSGETEIG